MPLFRARSSRGSLASVLLASLLAAACTSDPPDVALDAPDPVDALEDAAAPDDVPASPDVSAPRDVTLDAPAADAPAAEDIASCPPGQVRCGEACIDTQTNNAHCGACANACPVTQVCRAGVCGAESMCAGGQMRCGDLCVDTATSDANCGACGNACPTSQRCVSGSCGTPRPCPTGQLFCNGACVNPGTDANHCGACGNACAAGQSCQSGACRGGLTCAAGLIACGGTCVDPRTDASHCGACGEACRTGMACTAGACVEVRCMPGQLPCGGACVDTATSVNHCGACGRACAPGQSCMAGVCRGTSSCPPEQTRCGESCADLRVDPSNCGACSTRCAAGESCVAASCRAGRPSCRPAETDCAPTAPAPSCVDTASSATNCGACGVACAPGQRCEASVCRCAAGQMLCGRSCVNTAADPANCGACGRACMTGQSCSAGACGCPPGRTLCGGACVDTSADVGNCGACARPCSRSQSCVAGRCSCAAGLTACGGSCVSTATDAANCGACGRACIEGQVCSAGSCACATGLTLCAGTCANLATSATNCGACGRACPLAQGCVAGRCQVVTAPSNDTRAGARSLDFSQASLSIAADTSLARHDADGACACTTRGNDVFFAFTLTQPEIVYADTLGAPWDTALFFQDARGNNVAATGDAVTCNDDAGVGPLCPGLAGVHSMVAARLGPGVWYLVLSGCGSGAATVRVQHLAAGAGAAARVVPGAAVQTANGSIPATAGTFSATCCSGGAESAYYWVTCPSTPTTTFHASTCSTAGTNAATFDVVLAQASALRPSATLTVCNDDVLGTCGQGASLGASIPATSATQAGLNTLIVDACTGSGSYAVRYVLANCSAGARCGSSCVDTTSDPAHCGGCDRRCSAGSVCVGGACRAPPSNDRPSGAVNIDLTRPSSSYGVSTAAASNDTAGSCGCSSGRDVFYNLTLTQPEIVYADTIGSSFDTSLFVQTRAGSAVTPLALAPGSAVPHTTTCNDDDGLLGCATGRQSQLLVALAAGEYRLVLSGCGEGDAVLHVQHAPVGSGTLRFVAPGSSVFTGTTAGVGRVTSACCSGGPEDTLYWYTCGTYRGGAFSASTCGRASWDTALDQRSATRGASGASVCNDDACGAPTPRQSSVSATIPAGAGLHTLYIDGCGGGGQGAYSLSVVRP